MGRQSRDPGGDREAVEAAEEVDAYLDDRIDPDATSAEEARIIHEAHRDDPAFAALVRRLRNALRLAR
jgi:hypothetical protein